MAFGSFDGTLGGVAGPFNVEDVGEQPYLVRVVAQPAAERVAGVVPVAVPVPQSVMDDAEGGSVVLAFPQALEQGRVKGGLPAGPGVLDGLVGLAQDGDHVGGPGLQAAGGRVW